MKRSPASRPDFPFLGAALLLAIAAAIAAISFEDYLAAVFLAALGLIGARLGMPTPEPIRIAARPSHDPHRED